MRLRVWVADLVGVSSAFGIFAISAVLLTVAAIVTGILGVYPATWWLITGTLVSLLIVVFIAYANAARERDARPAADGNAAADASAAASPGTAPAGPRRPTRFSRSAPRARPAGTPAAARPGPVIDDRDGSFTIIDELGPPLQHKATA